MRFAAPRGTTVVGALGTGAACAVWRVRAEGGAELACKRLLPHHRASQAARVSLVRETRALEVARHPAIPRLVGVGADAAGPYVLETVVEGPSLREVKAAWAWQVPSALARHVVAESARTLAELHALADDQGPLQLVHGDVAPDNLRLSPFGAIGVLDFGHARTRGFTADLETHALGTAPYLAPELARGEASPSPATDAYALAATAAWLLLDGEQPLVTARGEAAIWAAVGERGIEPSRLEPVTGALRDVLRRMLQLDPDARDATLSDLARAAQLTPP